MSANKNELSFFIVRETDFVIYLLLDFTLKKVTYK
jgi:hypothetical protein